METKLEILERKIRKLNEERSAILNRQSLCNHIWGEIKYDPEQQEITRREYVYQGSDSYYKEVGTGMYKNVDRWTRVCSVCDKKEYAYEQEEVIVKTMKQPKFQG